MKKFLYLFIFCFFLSSSVNAQDAPKIDLNKEIKIESKIIPKQSEAASEIILNYYGGFFSVWQPYAEDFEYGSSNASKMKFHSTNPWQKLADGYVAYLCSHLGPFPLPDEALMQRDLDYRQEYYQYAQTRLLSSVPNALEDYLVDSVLRHNDWLNHQIDWFECHMKVSLLFSSDKKTDAQIQLKYGDPSVNDNWKLIKGQSDKADFWPHCRLDLSVDFHGLYPGASFELSDLIWQGTPLWTKATLGMYGDGQLIIKLRHNWSWGQIYLGASYNTTNSAYRCFFILIVPW